MHHNVVRQNLHQQLHIRLPIEASVTASEARNVKRPIWPVNGFAHQEVSRLDDEVSVRFLKPVVLHRKNHQPVGGWSESVRGNQIAGNVSMLFQPLAKEFCDTGEELSSLFGATPTHHSFSVGFYEAIRRNCDAVQRLTE